MPVVMNEQCADEGKKEPPFCCRVCGKGFPNAHHRRLHEKLAKACEASDKNPFSPIYLHAHKFYREEKPAGNGVDKGVHHHTEDINNFDKEIPNNHREEINVNEDNGFDRGAIDSDSGSSSEDYGYDYDFVGIGDNYHSSSSSSGNSSSSSVDKRVSDDPDNSSTTDDKVPKHAAGTRTTAPNISSSSRQTSRQYAIFFKRVLVTVDLDLLVLILEAFVLCPTNSFWIMFYAYKIVYRCLYYGLPKMITLHTVED